MQNKSLSIIIAIVLVVGIGGWVYYQKQASIPTRAGTYEAGSPKSGTSDTPGIDTSVQVNIPSPPGFTMAQVAQHNSKASCWAVISGYVYDLTSWIPNHPGGEQAILQLCGTDGTAKFNGQHGNDSRAKGVLAGFKIGAITQ